MKSLNNYIQEKLIINKDYKQQHDNKIIDDIYNAIDKANKNHLCKITTDNCKLIDKIEETINILYCDENNTDYREKVIKKLVFDFYSNNNIIHNTFKKGQYTQCISINVLWEINNINIQILFTKIYHDIIKNKNYKIEEIEAGGYKYIYCKIAYFILFMIVDYRKEVSDIIILEL